MTKQDLVEVVRSHNDMQRREADRIVESVLGILKDTLASGEDVKISGFGKWVVNHKRERRGRNPHTGEDIIYASRSTLTFKPSTLLKQEINNS